jgi:hypothetical protein
MYNFDDELNIYFSENYGTWKALLEARAEGRLFAKLKWPKDAELVCLGRFVSNYLL